MASQGESPPANESSPSTVVVEAVAKREGVAPADLTPPTYEPLYTVVDPEALDNLFPLAGSDACVIFTYCGHEVTVYRDRTVEIDGEPVETAD